MQAATPSGTNRFDGPESIAMITLYVYDAESNTLVARIRGASNDACEAVAGAHYGDTDTYGWTYSPAFGASGGLDPGDDVEDIEACPS